MKTVIKQTEEMGRGVFANKAFKEGEIIETSPCLVLRETKSWIGRTELNYYVFGHNSSSDSVLLALGNGSLFNHSANPNVTYRYNPITNEMIFAATSKIQKGEQLFINYGYDPVYEKERRASWAKTPDPLSPNS